jgi:hypothetical protein
MAGVNVQDVEKRPVQRKRILRAKREGPLERIRVEVEAGVDLHLPGSGMLDRLAPLPHARRCLFFVLPPEMRADWVESSGWRGRG